MFALDAVPVLYLVALKRSDRHHADLMVGVASSIEEARILKAEVIEAGVLAAGSVENGEVVILPVPSAELWFEQSPETEKVLRLVVENQAHLLAGTTDKIIAAAPIRRPRPSDHSNN